MQKKEQNKKKRKIKIKIFSLFLVIPSLLSGFLGYLLSRHIMNIFCFIILGFGLGIALAVFLIESSQNEYLKEDLKQAFGKNFGRERGVC